MAQRADLSGLVIEGQPQPKERVCRAILNLSGLVIEGQPQRIAELP